MFESVDIFRKLYNLKSEFENKPRPRLSKVMEITKRINTLLDALKIVTCFESAFKAELIMKGYVVHWIDKSKYKKLRKRQYKSPIKIFEIKQLEGLTNNKNNNYKFNSLLDKTIPFSIFLSKSKYQAILKYPLRTFSILERINRTRNTLHFINQGGAFYNKPILDEYDFLDRVVKQQIVKRHNRLVRLGKKLGYATSPIITPE
jgi:hypothetical protein